MFGHREQLFRQLRILRKIQLNSSLNAKNLAQDLEVSERTIYRDINSLVESNFPIYFDNGYRLPENYFFPEVNFDIEELVTLFLSSRFLLKQKELPFYQPLKSALEKIEGVVQPEHRKILWDLENKFTVGIPEGIYDKKSQEIIGIINKAVIYRNSVKILYHTFSTDSIKERKLDPYGIFFSQDNWYLVAYCHLRKNVREFNIKRIREAEILNDAFNMPESFDISDYVSHSWDFGEMEPVKVKLYHSAKDARWIREIQLHPSQKNYENDDGSLFITVNVRAPENMISWILSRKCEVEVISPLFLKKAVHNEIKNMMKIYEKAAIKSRL